MSYQRVLVTGGAGFIGSHLVDALIERGIKVAIVDSLVTGHVENVNPDATLFNLDLGSPDLKLVFTNFEPEAVFHLAAQVSVAASLRDPMGDAGSNILGSLNLLAQCKSHGIKAFVYSSTGGALYGEPRHLPCPEDHPVQPLSPYGASKYATESYIYCFAQLAGFTYTILRYANVYGPRQDPDGEAGVVAIFTKRMLRGQKVSIYGDGTQERDFVYVGDVVQANLKAMAIGANNVYNIGTGKGTSVNQIFRVLSELAGYTGIPTYLPPRPGEVYKICLDSTKAQAELGWRPEVALAQGLALLVKHIASKFPP